MKAVVMAGGEGSRLRPLTSQRPKPLVPVGGRPIMEHILLLLRKHQARDVIATLQYLGASIRNHFGDGSDYGVRLTYSVEDSPLGTAGSVKLVEDELTETFLVISGDALTDIDLTAAVRFHKEQKALATIVLKPVPNPLEYGVVVTDEQQRVQRFLEKPSWGEVFSDLANTGIYVLEPEVFAYFERDAVVDWASDVFPRLLSDGKPVYGWIADGYWEDVGTHAAYLKANFDCLEGKVKVELPAAGRTGSAWVAEDAEIAADARIEGPCLIGPGSRIRPGAFINGPTVIGSYCTVDGSTKISNSVVWDHSYIGENCRLRGSVVCHGVIVKNGCLLEEGSVIGSQVVMGEGTQVNANVRIWPNKDIEAGAVVRESIIWAGSWRRGLFTAYGLSGLTNVEITPEFAARLGASIGALYPKGTTVAVSRDYSRSARMVQRALISGLISSGADIADLSAVTIPVARHWAHMRHVPAVHVQTSPVDPRSADIRIFDSNGLDLDKRHERKLENLFFREDLRRVLHGELGALNRYENAYERYQDTLLGKLSLPRVRAVRPKVLVDYHGGAAAEVLPRVLQEMGCEVIALNGAPGEAIERSVDEFDAHLKEMGVIVKAVGASLGAFIDSPAERCFLVDETGTILAHHEAFGALAELALQQRQGMILGPASSSLVFSMISEELGGRFVPTKTTPGAVLRAAQHGETILASDAAGGYCWPDFQIAFDAVFTVARTLEMLATSDATLSELRKRLPTVGYVRRDEFCPWEAKGRVMRTVLERHLKDQVDLTDGVKVFIDGGWVLVVPDADKPEYHIIASTKETASAKGLVDEYARLVREVVAETRPRGEPVVERKQAEL
ncbi:MAG TPA: sugar phosphate nucleotidyltransferase [Candidatus Dormibacteraeota bacterium]